MPTTLSHHCDPGFAPVGQRHVLMRSKRHVSVAIGDAEPVSFLKRPEHLRERLVNLPRGPSLARLAYIVHSPGAAQRSTDDVLVRAFDVRLLLQAIRTKEHGLTIPRSKSRTLGHRR